MKYIFSHGRNVMLFHMNTMLFHGKDLRATYPQVKQRCEEQKGKREDKRGTLLASFHSLSLYQDVSYHGLLL